MTDTHYMPPETQADSVMVNRNYEPSDDEDKILDVFKDGRGEGGPWGYATPRHLRETTEIKKGNVEYHLRQLTSAGWLKKVTRGFYRFVRDPRENDTNEH
jgi:hypothetical protein